MLSRSSLVQHFVTLWSVACLAPLSCDFPGKNTLKELKKKKEANETQGHHKEGNNKCLSHDLSIPLLVYPQDVKTYVQNIKMFISIFIHNIQVWKQEKYSLSGDLNI